MDFKKFLPWIIAAVVIIGIYSWVKGINNTAVSLGQTVEQSWGDVQTSYQRRNDLIGNLVNTVKGAADFEKSTIEAVIQARASATSIKINADDLTPEKLQQFQQAQSQLGGALGRLLAVAENYPQLKAVGNFSELQAQLEGTENRISEARRQFNESAQSYNASRQTFPRNIFAGLFGFKEKPYFQAAEGTEKAPEVKF